MHQCKAKAEHEKKVKEKARRNFLSEKKHGGSASKYHDHELPTTKGKVWRSREDFIEDEPGGEYSYLLEKGY